MSEPPSKKLKRSVCIICAHPYRLERHKEFSKTLITQFVPTSQYGTIGKSSTFDFCTKCKQTVGELRQLQADLELISKNIQLKKMEIKVKMSNRNPDLYSKNENTFRGLITSGPRIQLGTNSTNKSLSANDGGLNSGKNTNASLSKIVQRLSGEVGKSDEVTEINNENNDDLYSESAAKSYTGSDTDSNSELIVPEITHDRLQEHHYEDDKITSEVVSIKPDPENLLEFEEEESAVEFEPWKEYSLDECQLRENQDFKAEEDDELSAENDTRIDRVESAIPESAELMTRPPFSYTQILMMAIMSSENFNLRIRDIYVFFRENFLYFRNNVNWESSVRQKISLSNMFTGIRTSRVDGQRGCRYILNLNPEFHAQRKKLIRKLNTNNFSPYFTFPERSIAFRKALMREIPTDIENLVLKEVQSELSESNACADERGLNGELILGSTEMDINVQNTSLSNFSTILPIQNFTPLSTFGTITPVQIFTSPSNFISMAPAVTDNDVIFIDED